MENMELNDAVMTDTVEEIAEAVPSGDHNVKSSAVIGAAMVTGAAIWELALKPIGKKTLAWIKAKRAARKNKNEVTGNEETESEENEE